MCDQLKKLGTVWLGVFLAVLMFGSNISHSISIHLDHDDSHQHFAEPGTRQVAVLYSVQI